MLAAPAPVVVVVVADAELQRQAAVRDVSCTYGGEVQQVVDAVAVARRGRTWQPVAASEQSLRESTVGKRTRREAAGVR